MPNTSETKGLNDRDIYYYRRRLQNNVYHDVLERYYELARDQDLTQKRVAELIGKDVGQVCRYFAKPGNWTLSTVSDLLLAMGAELSLKVVPIHEDYHAQTMSVMFDNSFNTPTATRPVQSTERYYATQQI